MTTPHGFEETFQKWRRSLIDLSGRNRMLHYKASSQTVPLNRAPSETWTALVNDSGITLSEDEVITGSDGSREEIERELSAIRRRLRNLAGAARTFADEQGVHVAYVAIGLLHWPDLRRSPRGKDPVVRLPDGTSAYSAASPLLFVPVIISVPRKGGDWRLVLDANSPIETNPALAHAVAEQHELRVELEEDALSPEMVFDQWEERIRGRPGWSIDRTPVVLDRFSFRKLALLRALERAIDRIKQQPLLRALCGDAGMLLQSPAPPEYSNIDAEVSPQDVATVVPADASQLRAILAAKSGGNLVIQGPPGTGKSQTITNLIAALVASGKHVLFVAEKRAARDVVVGNLESAHLGELVLHITEDAVGGRSGASAKRDIAEQLESVLSAGPGSYNVDDQAPKRYGEVVHSRNEYDRATHQQLGQASWTTPHALIGRWAKTDSSLMVPEVSTVPSVKTIDQPWLDSATEIAHRLDDLGEEALAAAYGPWRNTHAQAWTSSEGTALADALRVLARTPSVIEQVAELHQVPADLYPDPWSEASVNALARQLEHLARYSKARIRRFSFARPTFWSTRAAAKRFLAAGGRMTGGEEASAERLREAANQASASKALVARYIDFRAELADYDALADRADELLETVASLPNAIAVKEVVRSAGPLGVANILETLVSSRRPGQNVSDLLLATLYAGWALEAVRSSDRFKATSQAHTREQSRLSEAIDKLATYARSSVLDDVVSRRPSMGEIAPKTSELGILRAQLRARRRKPLRWLFAHAPNVIRALKPCIVASPLAVAQFLDADDFEFDTVIFDEASQIPTADAVVPISRAKQVIVVGDSQQMPPTNYFDRQFADPNGVNDPFDFESVLQECEAILPTRRLLWHYRSRDERLIAFSNHNFYRGELYTFPTSWQDHPDRGVKFVYVPNGVYGRGGSAANPEEAERVVDLLADEVERDEQADVGVTAMSIPQSREIQARVEARAETDPRIESWIDRGGQVKNLETIQGDECDVMILSFGYGRDAAGTLHLNFALLSRENGYRRLNVAVTRAREKSILVASVRAADISAAGLGAGNQLVRQYLDYAERGPSVLGTTPVTSGQQVFESDFEESVARALQGHGWNIDTQVGVGRYRIDIGVQHPDEPGRYIAGIECDGATYHSAQSARDRDVARQQVLEGLGWTILRVWGPEWFRDRERVLQELHETLRNLVSGDGTRPGDRQGAVASARPEFVQANADRPEGTSVYREHRRKRASERDSVSALIASIIIDEGPLHEDELFQALRADYGYGSIGSRIRRRFERALLQAVKQRSVTRRGSGIWPAGLDPKDVVVRVNRGEEQRRFEHYPDEELIEALTLACESSIRLTRDQLFEVTTRFLGYRRCTTNMRERLNPLVSRALADGLLIGEGGKLRAG